MPEDYVRPVPRPGYDRVPIEGGFDAETAPRAEAKPQHIFVLGNDVSMLVNFRGALIKAMLAAGHRVTAGAAGRDAKAERWLADHDVAYREIAMERAGLNPVKDSATLLRMIAAFRQVQPDLLFAYTIKPVVYGLLAARLVGVKRRTAMITGLGYAFTEDDGESANARLRRRAIRRAAQTAYGAALRFADTVIFQNPDDRAQFETLGLLKHVGNIGIVNGSGVDLDHFTPQPMPEGPPVVLMIARLLRDKGVYEYVEAARLVKRERPDVTFVLAGPFDPNPTAVKPHEVEAWVREGLINYKGAVDDVRPLLAACHIFVLPSYYGEGIPRTILEAMATGRPIITTDWRGCRETLRDGTNGVLVPTGDGGQIARSLQLLLDDTNSQGQMASASLAIARNQFDARTVSAATLNAVFHPTTPETSAVAKDELPSCAARSGVAPSAP